MPRQRSPEAHQKVLDAAFQLFSERGIDRASMDAIAETSGVSKATIYKHWADKEALLLEVLVHLCGLNERPRFDSGDTRADLVAALAYHPPREREDKHRQLMRHLIAYSAHNPTFGKTWRAMAIEPARQELRQILARGIENGQLVPDLNQELAVILLLGPLLYAKIFGLTDSPRFKHLPNQVVDAFWRAFSVKPREEADRLQLAEFTETGRRPSKTSARL
ncbi:MAG: TetR/AcrR family transcriptional regulator [Bryobacteraceae bacterium]